MGEEPLLALLVSVSQLILGLAHLSLPKVVCFAMAMSRRIPANQMGSSCKTKTAKSVRDNHHQSITRRAIVLSH